MAKCSEKVFEKSLSYLVSILDYQTLLELHAKAPRFNAQLCVFCSHALVDSKRSVKLPPEISVLRED